MLEILGSFRQPTYCLETVKIVLVDGWTKIVHVCCCKNITSNEWLGVCVEKTC